MKKIIHPSHVGSSCLPLMMMSNDSRKMCLYPVFQPSLKRLKLYVLLKPSSILSTLWLVTVAGNTTTTFTFTSLYLLSFLFICSNFLINVKCTVVGPDTAGNFSLFFFRMRQKWWDRETWALFTKSSWGLLWCCQQRCAFFFFLHSHHFWETTPLLNWLCQAQLCIRLIIHLVTGADAKCSKSSCFFCICWWFLHV